MASSAKGFFQEKMYLEPISCFNLNSSTLLFCGKGTFSVTCEGFFFLLSFEYQVNEMYSPVVQ